MASELGPAKITVELDTAKLEAQLATIRNQVEAIGDRGGVGEGGDGGDLGGGRGRDKTEMLRKKGTKDPIINIRTKRFIQETSQKAAGKRIGLARRGRRFTAHMRTAKGALGAAGRGAMMGMGRAAIGIGARGLAAMGPVGLGIGIGVAAVGVAAGTAYAGAVTMEQMGPMMGEFIKELTKDTVFEDLGELVDERIDSASELITEEVTSRVAAFFPAVGKTTDLQKAKYLLGGQNIGTAEVGDDFEIIYNAQRAMQMGERHQKALMNEVTGGLLGNFMSGALKGGF